MPGIVGIIRGTVPREHGEDLRWMLSSMRHEGFYSLDARSDKQAWLSIGWIGIDQSSADAMFAETGDTRVVISGEIFGDVEGSSGEQSENVGQHARRVLRAYEAKGESCIAGLNGWFGGVIHDRRRERIIVFNDRYGHGRLYWHSDAEGFYFASEAKALLAIKPKLRSLDPQGLGEWLSCGCVLQNRTLFPGVFLLPPASSWTFDPDGGIAKNNYFQPEEWENQSRLSADAYIDRLGEILPDVLGRYLVGKGSTALSLTGGLDGRIIMAWAGAKPGELPCYTFNGPYRECADARIARRVAKACGQSHQIIPIGEEFFKDFADLAAKSVYLSDGTMDVTGAAELYLNRDLGQIAPVRLTGNYGSEVLREYVAFRPSKQSVPGIDSDLIPFVEKAEGIYAKESEGDRLSFIAFKQVPWHHYARSSIERSQLTVRSPFLDNDLIALAYQAPNEAKTASQLFRLIANGAHQLGTIPNDRGMTYPADSIVNRMKRSYHEFMAKAEYAYDYGMPQRLARVDHRLSALHLERLFLGHQKFCHFRIWYRYPLSETIREILLDSRTLRRDLFDAPIIERLVGEHLGGTHNHTITLHKLLSLELLLEAMPEGGALTESEMPRSTVPS